MQKIDGINKKKNRVLRPNKSLYGLKKSPRYWNNQFNIFIQQQNFEQSKDYYFLYSKSDGLSQVYVLWYVNNLLIMGNDLYRIKRLKSKFKQTFKITDMGKVQNCLGINIIQKEGIIQINPTTYLKNVFKEFEMADCNPFSRP